MTTLNAEPQRIGDILVAHGAIARGTIEQYASRARGKIGHYLYSHNLVLARDLSRGLAAYHDLAFVDFNHMPPDRSLFVPRDLPNYIAHHYVPFAQSRDGLIVATSEPSPQLQSLLEKSYKMPVRLVITGPRDLTDYFASIAATTTTRHACLSLRRKYKHLVADRILTPPQVRGLLLLCGLLLAVLLVVPQFSWQIILLLCNLLYLLSLGIKIQLYQHGLKQLSEQQAHLPELCDSAAALHNATLPIYTILVPLYMENAAVMSRLIESLNALDYPRDKLDIKLICEADDHTTIEALKALRPPQMMHILTVAPSKPRTKPKACNVALQQIRGEFLVIFDAEDAPASDQLRRAVHLFRTANHRLACLQAPLNYYNRNENLLTQLFAIEYSTLFRINLPALERLRMPIPLGGTSNHLRVAALKDAGGWDAFNVTEDADLGIRLAYFGYETRILPSLTLEECPISLRAWIVQRTRWIKGYIQTWLVYMRDPSELKNRLGSTGYYGFQFFFGLPALTFLLAPVFWAIYLVSLTGYVTEPLPPFLHGLCLLSFVGGLLCNWMFARAVLHIERWENMRRALLLYPLYWLLHSVAAARALWQLFVRPHHWGKTRHGVSRLRATWHRKSEQVHT
jgi:cellulose synthase/poly-beta-1,6-N-acetylglucosamine synthase-like glycosyltransferase